MDADEGRLMLTHASGCGVLRGHVSARSGSARSTFPYFHGSKTAHAVVIAEVEAGSMRQTPDLTGLPSVIDAIVKPWVDAVESTGLGMGSVVASAVVSATLSINRRVMITSDLSGYLAEARNASEALAQKLDRQMPAPDERKTALAALAVLTDKLRISKPSDSTRALGLGW
jgi:hypothetical protein